jgi:DNA-binding transcriptional LysR family regulator
LDRFTGMAVFAKVVESASFAAAARHFDMSPAMVSKHVRTLEQRLGVQLLNRTTRHVSATEVGQNYYERCLRILGELEDSERAASDLQTAPRGLLRVTTSVSFGAHQLAPAIADYLVAYPDVSVDLKLRDQYVDLVQERIDVAIRLGRLADSSLIARKLYDAEMILCASPSYLAANGTPQKPRDLMKHQCLIYTYTAPQTWTFTDQNGRADVIRLSGRVFADSGDALLALARKGAGVVLGPDYLVGDDLRAGNLVRLLPGHTTPDTPIYAVYPHSDHLSAKTRTFIDFLVTRFAHFRSIKPAVGNGKDVAQSSDGARKADMETRASDGPPPFSSSMPQ